MLHSIKLCRFIVLLLSLTLSAQAMAVASLGSCHRMKALTAVHQVSESTPHHHADSEAPHDGLMHHAESSGKAPASDYTRVSCAACASCHLSIVIPNSVVVSADIPVVGATIFPAKKVPRVRNVASGLERPPRA